LYAHRNNKTIKIKKKKKGTGQSAEGSDQVARCLPFLFCFFLVTSSFFQIAKIADVYFRKSQKCINDYEEKIMEHLDKHLFIRQSGFML
jgi:hypothetical protein